MNTTEPNIICNILVLLAEPQCNKIKVVCSNPKKGSKVYCSIATEYISKPV